MRKLSKLASGVNIVVNVFLFFIKIIVGVVFASVSLIADAINSLSDIIAAFFIYVCVRVNDEDPDDTHEFGHSRAENIAGYTVGILMIVLGVSVIKIAVDKLINNQIASYSNFMLGVVAVTFFVKLGMFFFVNYVLKRERSPALQANLKDHLNDMIIILGVLVAIVSIRFGYYYVDPVVGILIGLFILKGGYEIAKENIGYLMGIPADKHLLKKIRNVVEGFDEVLGIDSLKSQYLGSKVQVEVHVAFNKDMSLLKSHDVGNLIRDKVEEIDEVNHCFVHINPK